MCKTLYDVLQDWPGTVDVDGEQFFTVGQARTILSEQYQNIQSIKLCVASENTTERKKSRLERTPDMYRITVRQYMTKPSSSDFDFMLKWNNDVPMPLRTMVGTIEKETPGMLYMKLHGDITSTLTSHCLKCGRPITNPVSQYFGMGPECGDHNYTHPFDDDNELRTAVEEYRQEYLRKIVWEGWIIKSAIVEQEVIE